MCLLIWTVFSGERWGPYGLCAKKTVFFMLSWLYQLYITLMKRAKKNILLWVWKMSMKHIANQHELWNSFTYSYNSSESNFARKHLHTCTWIFQPVIFGCPQMFILINKNNSLVFNITVLGFELSTLWFLYCQTN